MKCVSALSTLRNTAAALDEVVSRLALDSDGPPTDLALGFASPHHAEALGPLSATLRSRGLARHVLGCTGETVIGDGVEVEGAPALSVWAAQLPDVRVEPRRITFDEGELNGWNLDDPAAPRSETRPTLVLLGDPFSFPVDHFLKRLRESDPGVKIVGGMASGSQVPRGNSLVIDDEVFDEGAVAVALSGRVGLRTVVSQGCRPAGRTMIVTRAEGNIIRDLGRRPVLEVLREMFDELPPADQTLIQEGLHIGRVINEYQETFQRGDFLIRNVLGTDDDGGLAITDIIKVGQTVQFQVRDAASAHADLLALLEAERSTRPAAAVKGALLFSCNGRGTRLFAGPNHDVGLVRRVFGPIPVAGFFAMGEIGPVGGQNFVHGYTASLVLFEEPQAAD
jgi:small ligand-binding sensory domain FIST